jgi:hypothetical protein
MMRRAVATVGFVTLLSGAGQAQSPQNAPKFDIADVHARTATIRPRSCLAACFVAAATT